LISAAANRIIAPADVWCTLYPSLRTLLASDITSCTELDILGAVLSPVRANLAFYWK
jgi:hypothetical protein